jgi:hypothetical protein
LFAAVLAASMRLAFMSLVAGGLFLLLVNAIVDAVVYAIAGTLALFWSSCSVLGVGQGDHAPAPHEVTSDAAPTPPLR